MDKNQSSLKCIHCGNDVDIIFKKYSGTVLKLIDCDNCKNVADKYVEYDIVIVIIDLVLLQKEAYRHILFNTEFKNFWKLSVVLLLTETYSEWTHTFSDHRGKSQTDLAPSLKEVDMDMVDIEFYKICLQTAIKTACFHLMLFLFTEIHQKMQRRNCRQKLHFMSIWKTVTVSSFGTFLLLPTLIWDMTSRDFHISIVLLYTTLSQLIAYTGCSKCWCLIAVFSAYCCKSSCLEFMNFLYPQ